MKLIILAAGYATRLYPLTLNQPKPLLDVAGMPMIERVLESLAPVEGIDQAYVVTNAKFVGHFQRWASRYRARTAATASRLLVIDPRTIRTGSVRSAISTCCSRRAGGR